MECCGSSMLQGGLVSWFWLVSGILKWEVQSESFRGVCMYGRGFFAGFFILEEMNPTGMDGTRFSAMSTRLVDSILWSGRGDCHRS